VLLEEVIQRFYKLGAGTDFSQSSCLFFRRLTSNGTRCMICTFYDFILCSEKRVVEDFD